MPLRDIANELQSKIGNRRVCLARYGQKAALTDPLKAILEGLSQKFEVHVAVAVETKLDSFFVSCSTQGQKLDNCFPFLFSPLVGNLELKKADSSSKMSGSYRSSLFILGLRCTTLCSTQKDCATIKSQWRVNEA